MPHHDDRHGSNTRLYVGHLSSRTRSQDLEHIFSRYGRVRDVDVKRDYAFVEFRDPRDAGEAKYNLDGRDVDGRRITVEFAKGVPRGPGGGREFVGRGPTPGSGRCFNCGIDGHWARDCTAGDWKNKCYRCGDRGHLERNCQNSPKKLRRDHSYSRSPVMSRSPRRGRSRSRSRSFSKSHSYSRSRSPARRGRDVEYDERRSRSPGGGSPLLKRGASPSKSRIRSPTPVRDSSRERRSPSPMRGRSKMERNGYSDNPKETSHSPRRGRMELEQDGYSDGPKETSRSPVSPAAMRYEAANGHNCSPSPNSLKDDRSPVDDDDIGHSPRGSESP